MPSKGKVRSKERPAAVKREPREIEPAPVFADWGAAGTGPRSEFFRAKRDDLEADGERKLLLCEELLFTQSNARVLIGQTVTGKLRFLALPTQEYPAPMGVMERTGSGIDYQPGQYHQYDSVMYLGDLSYRLLLSGDEIDPVGEKDESAYVADFLPCTRGEATERGVEAEVFSFAPVAEDGTKAALSPAPLPGPAGAFFVLRVRNRGPKTLKGKVLLNASDCLVVHRSEIEKPDGLSAKPQAETIQHTLFLNRSFGSVGIHMHDGIWKKTREGYRAERPVEIPAGGEIVIETRIAAAPKAAGITPEIYRLYMRSGLDWLNLTASFWRSRLGGLSVGTDRLPRLSRDIFARCILDNFNCLQTDAQGNLIAHWQGAPSHRWETVWGIDVEPTAVSVMNACPELGRRVLEYFMVRSRSPRSKYPEHSVPVLVAPVIIARKWFEVSGDAEFFRGRRDVWAALGGIMRELAEYKAKGKALFASRYSSDGRVERRYDFGTNVKVAYVYESYAYLLERIGRKKEAKSFSKTAGEIREAIRESMTTEGAFGPQFSGGANLGENQDGFYLADGVPYYDGEDSSSALAPIYGFCDYRDPLWINYHRFARSLWCHNFDPEYKALRWTGHWWPDSALDGTAYVSRLGGAVTRAEMAESLEIMREYDCEQNGSLWWWPLGRNFKRHITRCSQGQGAWAWQYLEQWLGLHVDAGARTITVAPRGLISHASWEDFSAGPNLFAIYFEEKKSGMEIRLRNKNGKSWTLSAGLRPAGAGADAPLVWRRKTVGPGREIAIQAPPKTAEVPQPVSRPLMQIMAERLGDGDGIVLARFGHPYLYPTFDHKWDDSIIAVRLLVVNGTGQDWAQAEVDLALPEGWTGQGRAPGDWTWPGDFKPDTAKVELGEIKTGADSTAPFWVKAPFAFDHRDACLNSNRLLDEEGPGNNRMILPSPAVQEPAEIALKALLSGRKADGSPFEKHTTIKIQLVPAKR